MTSPSRARPYFSLASFCIYNESDSSRLRRISMSTISAISSRFSCSSRLLCLCIRSKFRNPYSPQRKPYRTNTTTTDTATLIKYRLYGEAVLRNRSISLRDDRSLAFLNFRSVVVISCLANMAPIYGYSYTDSLLKSQAGLTCFENIRNQLSDARLFQIIECCSTCEFRCVVKLILYPKKLVILRDPVGTAAGTCLDLSRRGRNRYIRNRCVFGLP